ncbi:formate--phosphoribosylaminoimidazolecarboxamide ligase [Nitrosopumilus maritimus]|uniref:5-formaminoimidazole-4-carboxamide-1-(beta)-D-ribofuranosyl 5'-monophosphate synthetase n=1 Tax=Nitrosopumilus maritimus (strain SCM1) TaxID=436308 RepID=PURP_NITMS|nr:formate--phosphoribosylaminoimidazolecarboxamide ligase [Nitrosopumilus maritimus]A9A1D3.1 RecName: Full=5-formaminoimidazole-4-carboxamide-1-(beta)-D-ribofuranosyl 5'-monophosphate synthetase; AltName: Full=5-aminoimidazole-4-carboxamide-1-beta-D-ribofuranosyl 5'-monophosphate--formate ligase [Nitrosopumilus maritimus SCM1]ABX12768.1 IMP biosynthesis enzyme PurP domain protein [Nitrosopumilus maritimus SCM1]
MASIATLGSHCSLQVLKGAKDEGLKTILVCEKKREKLYRRFPFIDELIIVDKFREVLDEKVQSTLEQNDAVLIPHGTLIAQMSSDEIESIKTPIFGNKWILRWESDREMKEKLMREATLPMPKPVTNPSEIEKLSIVKRQGAAGGKGYFMAANEDDYNTKRNQLISEGVISEDETLYIQEYAAGVLAYLTFFYSPLKEELEFYGVDQRHESDIEGLGRIPAEQQMKSNKVPSFNVIGNSPLVLRESLLDEVYTMGENFVEASKRIVAPGMNGPFCIEGVYDENAQFTSFEFSARIVAGSNIYMDGSPYYNLLFNETMSMGKRIAREVKTAAETNQLDKVTT